MRNTNEILLQKPRLSLEKFQIFYEDIIHLYGDLNFSQFSSVTDNKKQLILEKHTCYLYLEHTTTKQQNLYKLSEELYLCLTRTCHDCTQKQTKVNSTASKINI
jgi:hypothetical protein